MADVLREAGRGLPFFPRQVPDWSRPIILALLLVALALGARSLVAGARARRLARQRQELVEDVGLLQRALLPEAPRRFGPLSISVAYRPADGPAAGGDFYDVFELDGSRLAVVLGDVSGHGREALARATLARYTVRAYLQAGLEPRAALAVAGRALTSDLAGGFATVAAAIVDGAAGTLTYALAGHPPPILLGSATREPVTACSSPPVGFGLPTGRRQTTLAFRDGALACFYTDGLPEARGADGLLGRERLAAMLRGLGPAAEAHALLARVTDSAERAGDDMAACLVAMHGGREPEPLVVEELELSADELDGPGPERFLDACGVAPAKAREALAAARAEVGDLGRVVMRVRVDGDGAAVEVTGAGVEEARSQPALSVTASA